MDIHTFSKTEQITSCESEKDKNSVTFCDVSNRKKKT